MTKEELKQEAEEWLCNNLHSASEEDFIKAMVDIAEPREKQLDEFRKVNVQVHADNICVKNENEYLRKENAELKADFLKACKVKEQGFREAEQALERKDDQLTKAKEYIKLLLMNCVGVYESTGKTVADIKAEAEQFLKDSEVEK